MPDILDRAVVFSTAWFDVIAKTLDTQPEPYYTLKVPDYVAVVPMTSEGKVVLVQQYRPVVEDVTLELPSGHVEPGEDPEHAIRRELLEETGYQANAIEFLGRFAPDTGRLSNTMWCYFAPWVTPTTAPPEQGIEVVLCTQYELLQMVTKGLINPGLHLGVLLLAILKSEMSVEIARGLRM